jgi:hypothetical protein
VRSSRKWIISSAIAGKLPVAGFLTASIFGAKGFAQDGPALQGAAPGVFDTASIGSYIAIGAVVIALWALIDVIRSRQRLIKLGESYYQKEYIRELEKSRELIDAMRSHFVPYDAGRLAAGGKRSAAEFGEIVRLRAELEELKNKIDHARKEQPGPDGKVEPALSPQAVSSASVDRVVAAQYSKQAVVAHPDVVKNGKASGQMTEEELLQQFGKNQADVNRGIGKSTARAVQQEPQKQPPNSPHTVYYTSLPDRDGTFKNLKKKQEWDSLYMLRPVGDPANATKATVNMCNNPDTFKAALEAPRLYLIPVCDYDRYPPSIASEIIVVRHGIAERASPGGSWKIKEKLQIDFK